MEMSTNSVDEIKPQIEELLTKKFDDLIRDTQKIISFPTVSGGTPEQEKVYQVEIPKCLEWLKSLAEEHGFNFQNWDNHVAEIEWAIEPEEGEGKRPVFGIASHIDVVTPAGNWTHGPFDGTIKDDVLIGRGIQDDKGPLIQALYGMIAVKEAGIRPKCDIRLIIGTVEETGNWTDMEKYLQVREAPDYGFTPDAEFPIITGEKGMSNVKVSAKWDKVKPNEETHMEFVSFKGGERTNIVPALTEILLRFPVEAKTDVMKELVRETTRFTVENPGSNVTLVPNNDEESEEVGYYEALLSFVGKAAHSSTPHHGHNAIIDSLKFFSDIETMPRSVRAFIQFLAYTCSDPSGANLAIDSEHPFVGKTTNVISLIDIGPEGGSANLNIRPTMGLTVKEVITKVQEAARLFNDATGLEISADFDGRAIDAIYLDPERPGIGEFLESLKNAYQAVTGEEGECVAIGGTTYAKALPNTCAFGPVKIGVDEELAHQADERLSVDSIKRNALIYALSIALMQ